MTTLNINNIDTSSGNTLSIKASNTTAITVSANGNIGIKNTSPTDKLSIQGTIRATEGIKLPDGNIQTTAAIGYNNTVIFTSPGTFTAPPTTSTVKVTVVGGGGGGWGRLQDNPTPGFPAPTPGSDGGSDGGGGGTAIGYVSVTGGASYPVTVGAGGAAAGTLASDSSPPATIGGTSSFGSGLSATGGRGDDYGSGAGGSINFNGTYNAPGTTLLGYNSQLRGPGKALGIASHGVKQLDVAPPAPSQGYGAGGEGSTVTTGTGRASPGTPGVVIVEYWS